MKYLTQARIAEYREATKPGCCPILQCGLDDAALDHDHNTGMVRGVLSRTGNSLLGKAENHFNRFCKESNVDLPTALRNMADYLEQPQTDILHPVGCKQRISRFRGLSKNGQIARLLACGASESDVSACQNSVDRVSLYSTTLKRTKFRAL